MRDGKQGCLIDACDGKHSAKGLCVHHYNKLRKHGDPLSSGTIMPRGMKVQWIYDHVTYNETDCLFWPFLRFPAGYGQIRINGSNTAAHRLMCKLAHGDRPTDTHMALHKCGRGKQGCVNPKHLYWGTAKDNARDSLEHGAFHSGERQHAHKLTNRDVMDIRMAFGPATLEDLAKAYGVAKNTIRRVVTRKGWKHIP